jgi:uncharacterized membrane protein YfcA
MIEFLLLFTIALVVSLISGIVGLGGAIILIPAYLHLPEFFDIKSLDIKIISGITSIQVFASSLFGVLIHKRRGNVGRSLLLDIGIPMALSALAGAVFSDYINSEMLLIIFALMALTGSVFMIFRVHPGNDELTLSDIEYNKPLALTIAVVIGLFGGMVGAPGAFLLAPLMISLLKIPVRITIGSTLGIILLTSFTASVGKIIAGQVDFKLTAYAVLGSILGITLGSKLSYKIKPKFLRISLASIIIVIALELLVSILI